MEEIFIVLEKMPLHYAVTFVFGYIIGRVKKLEKDISAIKALIIYLKARVSQINSDKTVMKKLCDARHNSKI